MQFKIPAMDTGAHGQQSAIYHPHSPSSSSNHSHFTEHAMRGFSSGSFGGGVHIGVQPETLRGRIETREAIQREIEKQRIREEILAEEILRKRILEEEVRKELRMEREMMSLRSGGGVPSPFMPLSLSLSHNNLLEPRNFHGQPVGVEERITTSLERKFANGSHCSETRGLELPFQRPSDSRKIKRTPAPPSEDTKKGVIGLGNAIANGKILCGTKRKSAPSLAACSTELLSDGGKKKLKEEWRCDVCKVSSTSERALNDHLRGKKHQSKEAVLVAQKTGANFGLPEKPIAKLGMTDINLIPLENKPITSTTPFDFFEEKSETSSINNMKKEDCNNANKSKFWCKVCQVAVNSEKVMKHHKEGKRHLNNLIEFLQKGGTESEPQEMLCDSEEKTQTETKRAVSADGDEKQKRDDFKFWCEMCKVGTYSEAVKQGHEKGKKHLTNLVEFLRKRKPPATQKTCVIEVETDAKTTPAVTESSGI